YRPAGAMPKRPGLFSDAHRLQPLLCEGTGIATGTLEPSALPVAGLSHRRSKTMKHNLPLALGVAFVASTLSLAAQTSTTAPKTHPQTMKTKTAAEMADRHFVKTAAEGGMAEVQLGQLAVEKASNPKVKDFGQRMVTDHGKANDELKSIAASKNI